LLKYDGKIHPLCGIYRKELYTCMEKNLLQSNNRVMSIIKDKNVKYMELDHLNSKYVENVNTRFDYENMMRGS